MEGMRRALKAKMGWVAVFLGTLALGIFLGKGWDRAVLATETYEELKTFTEVLALVQKHYVEETKTKDLVYGAIRGMLSTLDPHSAFMPPDVYKEVQVETKGEFGGIGIQIGMKENRLTVIAPIDGTPAEKAGVKAGDMSPPTLLPMFMIPPAVPLLVSAISIMVAQNGPSTHRTEAVDSAR